MGGDIISLSFKIAQDLDINQKFAHANIVPAINDKRTVVFVGSR